MHPYWNKMLPGIPTTPTHEPSIYKVAPLSLRMKVIPKIFSNQPANQWKCKGPRWNWKYAFVLGQIWNSPWDLAPFKPKDQKRQDDSQLTDTGTTVQNPVTKIQLSIFTPPFPIIILITMESGEPNSHELLIFCGPYAHIGVYDSWLSDRLTANILFPLFISKRAINLETTASGRRVKASHRSCVIISVIVSWCCWACCCKAEKDFHAFPLPPKWPFSWGWMITLKLNKPQNYGSAGSIKGTPQPPNTLSCPFLLSLYHCQCSHFWQSKKFWKDLRELYVCYRGQKSGSCMDSSEQECKRKIQAGSK